MIGIVTHKGVFNLQGKGEIDFANILKDIHGVANYTDLNTIQTIDYFMINRLKESLLCCDDAECKNSIDAKLFLDALENQIGCKLLVTPRAVITKFDFEIYRRLLELVEDGFHIDDARNLMIGGFII